MTVLVTGATGLIGAAVTRLLVGQGLRVVGVARTADSAAAISSLGAKPIRGSIETAAEWLPPRGSVTAVVHAANGFSPDMAAIEAEFLHTLSDWAEDGDEPLRMAYTGGAWLYGRTGDHLAEETDPLSPPASWTWAADHIERLRDTPSLYPVIIHPGLVWQEDGGAIAGYVDAIRAGRPIEIIGDPQARAAWVHAADLAELYIEAINHGDSGEAFNAAGDAQAPYVAVARALAARLGSPDHPIASVTVAEAQADMGDWAEGFALDQGLDCRRALEKLGWIGTASVLAG